MKNNKKNHSAGIQPIPLSSGEGQVNEVGQGEAKPLSYQGGLMNNPWPSLTKLAADVKSGALQPSDLVAKSLNLIEAAEGYNAVLFSFPERARQKAAEIELKLNKGEDAGPLAGIPFLVKDNFLIKGEKMTAASNILNDFISPYTATAVEKLEAAGAICVGKTNLDAFAHGGSTENSDFGPAQNPHDLTRVPGGSSGGSAAAVALSLSPFALGSDTGGSIRLPASFCGVVGLKPSYGAVSRYGVVSMASSTDCIGPITNSVEDATLILSLISGIDPLDSTTIELGPIGEAETPSPIGEGRGEVDPGRHPELYSGSNQKNNSVGIQSTPLISGEGQVNEVSRGEAKKIGIIKQFYGEGLQPEVEQKTLAAINKFKNLGYQVEEVDLPSLALSLAAYYVIVPAEISSNLMRYDGIRYGLSLDSGNDLADIYGDSRSAGFNAENKRRIMIGAYVLSSGYYDAYYKRAQTVRTKIIEEFRSVFEKFDLLAGPVSPTTAFKLGQNSADPLAMYLADVMTVGVSLAGLPALSLPVGKDGEGLPIGLQLIANHKDDYQLLSLSTQLEKMLD